MKLGTRTRKIQDAVAAAPKRAGWEVVVVSATSQTYYAEERARDKQRAARMGYYDTRYIDSAYPIPGKLAVRLEYDGKPVMTYGIVTITDDDFEDQITTMKAAALEKAATLQAVGAVSA